MVATLNWDATQVDIKIAFLNGTLSEDKQIYMQQLKGFEEEGKECWICKLLQPIYDMKQAGCIWNKTLDDVMKCLGFTRLKSEACLYYRKTDRGVVIAGVYVNNFLSIASSAAENKYFKRHLKEIWTISDLEVPCHIVGMAIQWD